jgi:hypothetical protein
MNIVTLATEFSTRDGNQTHRTGLIFRRSTSQAMAHCCVLDGQ